MRAEDLFEAMGALDEQLIALSEEDGRRAREAESGRARKEEKSGKGKRRRRAEIYRFAAVAMTTAAAVFIMLTAREFLGARSRSYTQSAAESAEYSLDESAAEEAVQDTFADGAAELQAEPEVSGPDAGAVSKNRAAQDPDTAGEETAPGAQEAAKSAEETAESDTQKDAAYTADDREPLEEAPSRDSAGAPAAEKTAVDMLGDLKGNYVRLEIMTAEDQANGGERRVPEYSEEMEKALTAALEDGQKMPVLFVRLGRPVGYVFLADSTGKEDVVTFYENGYVGISTIPSFVMKVSDEEFEDVVEIFR